MPAAIRARSCGSGPTPKGNSITASTKNATTRAASLPCRSARRRSRPTTATKRPHAALRRGAKSVSESVRGSASGTGWCVASTTHAAAGAMLGDDAHEIGDRGVVETGGGLVQQPERRRARQQARQRQPPALAGGEKPARQLGEPPRRKRASAAGTAASAPPRMRAQKPRVSATVSTGFSAS